MAQILRGFGPSGSTHTPGYSAQPAGRHAERRQRVDDQLLDVAHVRRRAEPLAIDDDRVADELARARGT